MIKQPMTSDADFDRRMGLASPAPPKVRNSPIRSDIDAAHRQRWPGRPCRWPSCAWLLASSPMLWLQLIHRLRQWLHGQRDAGGGRAWLARVGLLATISPKWLAQVCAKSEFRNETDFDGGVRFSERGQIFFGAPSCGAGSVIGTRVTVGTSHVDGGAPRIGKNVWIGSNCVLYGNITIGDGTTLLPGTVLTKSLPPHVVVQGNPARLVRGNYDNSALRALDEAHAMDFVATLGSA